MTSRIKPAPNFRQSCLSFVSLTCLAVVTSQTPLCAHAQDTPQEMSESSDQRVTYGPDYYGRFSPASADDILRVIPGVTAILDDSSSNRQERGFGSGGARVLLNSRRFPGKANDLTANLRRIPADAVERVELISGAASGISVQSEGIIVNVVLKEGESIAGTGSWEAYTRFNEEGRFEVDGLVSYNGAIGSLGYSLGVERNAWSPDSLGPARWSNRFRDETYYYPDRSMREHRPQDWERNHDKWIYTGGLTYDFLSGDRMQLNGFYQTLKIEIEDATDFTRFDTSGVVILEARDEHKRSIDLWETLEISGEYDASLWGGNLLALAILKRTEQPVFDFRNQITPGRTRELSQSRSNRKTGEDIFRASWSKSLREGMSVELGAEGARNTLDQSLRVFFDRNGDDLVEEVPIPTGEAEVEEKRVEAFLVHRWTPWEPVSLETSLTYEASEITNNFAFSPDRSLSFVKPRLDARYRVTPSLQARLLIDRSVSQLDFENFVPSFDFQVSNQRRPGYMSSDLNTVYRMTVV